MLANQLARILSNKLHFNIPLANNIHFVREYYENIDLREFEDMMERVDSSIAYQGRSQIWLFWDRNIEMSLMRWNKDSKTHYHRHTNDTLFLVLNGKIHEHKMDTEIVHLPSAISVTNSDQVHKLKSLCNNTITLKIEDRN